MNDQNNLFYLNFFFSFEKLLKLNIKYYKLNEY